ncbi:tail fiber protein [Pseudenhygromyxa sp. WMMC2535]|nr:tail fiber protein [Pseudenhygromyxa sp. WMMC2535]NVB41004.1 tail fiber protein [Pseudenhygromyxa sp. WMMC2535]
MAFAGTLGPPNPETASPPWQASSPPGDEAGHVTENLEAWGWMLCDGRELSTQQYPELFAVLGHIYGGSGGSFCIPDYRGSFWRGVDAGASVDPDIGERTAAPGGTQEGVGSQQPCALQTHEHTYITAPTTASPAGDDTVAAVSGSNAWTGTPTSDQKSPPGVVLVSDHETRPSNIYVNYIIKFTMGLRSVGW